MAYDVYTTRIKPRLDEIAELAKQKASHEKIAKMIGVDYSTLLKHKQKYSELSAALKGLNKAEQEKLSLLEKEEALMNACFKRACGYITKEEVREVKERKGKDGSIKNELQLTKVIQKEVPPDLAAAKWYMEQKLGEGEKAADAAEEDLIAARAVLDERDRILEHLGTEEEENL